MVSKKAKGLYFFAGWGQREIPALSSIGSMIKTATMIGATGGILLARYFACNPTMVNHTPDAPGTR
jgi:hypothetical protein